MEKREELENNVIKVWRAEILRKTFAHFIDAYIVIIDKIYYLLKKSKTNATILFYWSNRTDGIIIRMSRFSSQAICFRTEAQQ